MQAQASNLNASIETSDTALEETKAKLSVSSSSVKHHPEAGSAASQSAANIPIFDLREESDHPIAFSKAVGEAYQGYGFVGFTHHGISDELVDQAYTAFKAFFALPESVKQAYHQPGMGGARGYTGFGVEQAKDHHVPDLKEFWHIGREVGDENPYEGILLPNCWPQEVPEFKQQGYALYQSLDQLGRRILSILARFLQLPSHWFEHQVNFGNSILRPIHYPPINAIEPGQVRAAQHEDINLITLLLGSEAAGLEILGRDNQWHTVTTIPGTIVVNIGDMLQRLSNHRLPSTTHRVVNPETAKASEPRYSIPFFMHPNPDMSLAVLPQCIDNDHPSRYPEDIIANEYLEQRLREINLL